MRHKDPSGQMTMDRNRSVIWIKGIVGLISLLLSAMLCAQTDTGSAAAPSKTEPRNDAAENLGSKPHDNSFVIGNDDVLNINVWKEAEISRSITVRSDGKISLPLVGEVQATGRTPLNLEQEIAEKLKNY